MHFISITALFVFIFVLILFACLYVISVLLSKIIEASIIFAIVPLVRIKAVV